MLSSLRNLFRHRALLQALTQRELHARYRGSVLGFLWSFLTPLLLLAVYTFAFGYVLSPRLGAGPDNYALFLFTGILPWTWFSAAVLEGAGTVLGGGALLKKVVFPAEVLPLVAVLANGVQFLLSLPVLVVVLVLFGNPPDGYAVLVVPLLLIQLLLTAGLTLLVSALTVLFRDLRDILGHLMTLWFFTTPVIYELHVIPATFRNLMRFNPMAQVIRGWQDALFFSRPPSLTGLAGAAAVAVVTLVLGYFVFDRLREVFPEEV